MRVNTITHTQAHTHTNTHTHTHTLELSIDPDDKLTMSYDTSFVDISALSRAH
jgi:hypothetical protein